MNDLMGSEGEGVSTSVVVEREVWRLGLSAQISICDDLSGMGLEGIKRTVACLAHMSAASTSSGG
jgi:hypothetical protein